MNLSCRKCRFSVKNLLETLLFPTIYLVQPGQTIQCIYTNVSELLNRVLGAEKGCRQQEVSKQNSDYLQFLCVHFVSKLTESRSSVSLFQYTSFSSTGYFKFLVVFEKPIFQMIYFQTQQPRAKIVNQQNSLNSRIEKHLGILIQIH